MPIPPPNFSAAYALDPLLILALAAYDAMNGLPALSPPYESKALIKVDATMLTKLEETRAYSQSVLAPLKAVLADTNIFGFLAVDTSTRTGFVSLRGTQDFSEWMKDIDVLPSPFDEVPGSGLVHQGFHIVFKSIVKSLSKGTTQHLGGLDQIVVTGHSLGAAVAILAAFYLAEKAAKIPIQLWSFAGPRVAYPDFKYSYESALAKTYRIVNKWDLVPKMPIPETGYIHVGNSIVVDPGFTLDLKLSHRLDPSYKKGLQKLKESKLLKIFSSSTD
jgi:hypothetical protein